MRGTILGVHDGRGFLITADDRRLDFPLSEWRSVGTPVAGQVVDFTEEGGQPRAVFAIPGAMHGGGGQPRSGSFVLGIIALCCLGLGFLIPLLPTIAAFVLGLVGAGQAIQEHDNDALLMNRIAWIGALVMLSLGILVLLLVFAFIGTMGYAAIWHGVSNF